MTKEQAQRLDAAIAKYNEVSEEKMYWWDVTAKIVDFNNTEEIDAAINVIEKMIEEKVNEEVEEKEVKKLYFMGMGCDYDPAKEIDMAGSDVGNYRIRTTFHDKKGDVIFVEFGRGYVRENGKVISSIGLCVDHQHNTTEEKDCNEGYIPIDYEKLKLYRYTKKDIVAYINSTFGTEFDDIEVLDVRYSKFDCYKYCGDEFIPNYEEIEQAKKIYQYFYDFEKNVRGKKFPNHSAYFDGDVFKVLIHYNCYNDVVIIDDVFKYDFNYQPPAEDVLKEAAAKWNSRYIGIK